MLKFITFYSYKGGVGRSLALVNVAHSLAMKGRKVVILDFDLEAPGLDTMLEFQKSNHDGKGVIEYISEYKQKAVPPKNLREYTREVIVRGSGSIVLIPAGKKDSSYQVELSRLDWKDFYRKKDGFYFIENLKSQIKKEFNPDYVLIDSRTGLTDIGGVCTLHIPDMVVLLFGLNKQNLEGIEHVKNTIQCNPLGKEIDLLFVASPVPDGINLVEQRIKEVKDRLRVEEQNFKIVHYNSGLALEEKIVVAGEAYLPQKAEYEEISAWIIRKNSSDFENTLEKCREKMAEGAVAEAVVGYMSVARNFPSNEHVCIESARALASMEKYKEALECIAGLVKTLPDNAAYILETARIYERWGKRAQATKTLATLSPKMFSRNHGRSVLEVARIYDKLKKQSPAREWLGYAVEFYTSMPSCIFAFTIAEFSMALKEYSLAKEFYEKACESGEFVLPAAYNMGYAMYKLGDIGYRQKFETAIGLFEKAATSNNPLMDANRCQAMHYAYKYLGDYEKAMSCLSKVKMLLLPLRDYGSKFTLFSPTKYRWVTYVEFLKENKKETAAIGSMLKNKRGGEAGRQEKK
ncbi:MAG: AAA family ATPase [Elusimicrobia bacterium]|nr:AAA family ATPase [Elusimicrobiota bacterium]